MEISGESTFTVLLVDAGRIVGQARRTWLLRQKQLARTKAAYAALGGTEDEATAITSELLTAVTTDFLGADGASSAIAGVVYFVVVPNAPWTLRGPGLGLSGLSLVLLLPRCHSWQGKRIHHPRAGERVDG